MKIRLLVTSLICALVALPAVRAQEKKADQTEMGAKMEKASGAWRAAKKQAGDATKKDDTLAKLAVVKENLTAALNYEPAYAAEKTDAAEKAKFVAAFKDDLKAEIAVVDNVIAAVKAGKSAEEIKVITDEGDKRQKEAHATYKKKSAPKK